MASAGIPSGNIWFSVKDHGTEVLISISDDGNGMEEELQKAIRPAEKG